MFRVVSVASALVAPALLLYPLLKLKTLCARYDLLGFRLAYRIKQKIGGCYIGSTAVIHEGVLFPHGHQGIFISGDAKIGKNCVIFQQVTIGSNTLIDAKRFGAPTIGDNCYIGAGAKVVGNVTVGANCRIGANAVVYKDVPENCTVVSGGGMQVIPHRTSLDNRFINKSNNHLQYWNGSEFVPLAENEAPELEA